MRIQQRLLLIGPLLLILIILACSDNPLEVTSQVYQTDQNFVLKDTTLFAIRDTSYLSTKQLSTQFSEHMLIGAHAGLEARPILRFTTLPNGALVQDVKIRFVGSGLVPGGSGGSFTATAFPILNNWESNTDSVWQDYTLNFDASSPLGDLMVTDSAGADTMILQMNQTGIDLFQQWVDTVNVLANFGLILDFSSAGFMKYLKTRANSTDPLLIISYKETTADTVVTIDSLTATFDAFVYTGSLQTTADRNYVSTLQVYRMLLKFDLENMLSAIPTGFEVVSANLQLPVDQAASLRDTTFGTNLVVLNLTTEFDATPLAIDSTSGRSIDLKKWGTNDEFLEITADIDRQRMARALVQPLLQQINNQEPSGFLIEFDSLTEFLSTIAFYKSSESNANLRPKLILKYQVPNQPRF